MSRAVLDSPLCSVSASGLKRLLVGEDPIAIGRLYDKMYKHTQTYGRRGAAMHVISGVGIALGDILGKVAGLPVHQLPAAPASSGTRSTRAIWRRPSPRPRPWSSRGSGTRPTATGR